MAKPGEKQPEFSDERDEIAYLRQKFSSMVIRGHYKECFKLIEEKMKLLYFKERWPENFVSSLALHKRCYPSMDISKPYDEYLGGLLRKNNIPVVFVQLLKEDKSVQWSAAAFQKRVLESQAAGQKEEALGYAQLMVKTDALSTNAHLVLGWAYRDLDRHPDAAAAFQRALELNKGNLQANLGLAEVYGATQPEKGLAYLEEALEKSPAEPELHAAKAHLLIRQGDMEGALAAYDEANNLDPLNPSYLYQKGELYDQSKQAIAAIRQYHLVLALNENHIPALTRLAILTASNQPEQALKYANTITRLQPENLEMGLLRARLLEKTGNLMEATRQYKRAIELDEGCHRAYGALGRLAEDPAKALSRYQKAAELAPDQGAYYMGIAKSHHKLGDVPAAKAAYQEVLSRDKSCHAAYAALGLLEMDSDPKAALALLGKALALDPENARYHRAKGELLATMKADPKEILACYDTAVRYDPGSATLRVMLARVLEHMGNLASATDHYRTAVSLDPRREEAHHGLVRLLLYSDPEAALFHINSALALSERAEYYALKSQVYMVLGQHREVLLRLRQSIPEDEANLDAWQELAQLLDGDTPRVAMMYINRALELSPEHPIYLCLRAGLLGDLGDFENALTQYQRALATDPNCHQALYGVGRLLAGRDDKKALEHLERAEALEPVNPRYTAEKALCLGRDPDRYLEALDVMDEAIAKDKRMWDIVLAKAKLLEQHGEPLPAIEHYRRVLLTFPDCLEANARMGVLLADYNPRAALVFTDKAIALDPERYPHYIWRGRLLHVLGDGEAAEESVRQGLELGGETEAVYRALAELLSDLLPDTALEYCRKAEELSPEQAFYPLLRGNIYRKTDRTELAMESFGQALSLDAGCHEALARRAELFYRQGAPESLEEVDRALELNSGNASYHHLHSLILEHLEENLPEAAASQTEAVRLAPGSLEYRERLVELLGKTRAPFRRMSQKRKLEKLRKRLGMMEETARAELPQEEPEEELASE